MVAVLCELLVVYVFGGFGSVDGFVVVGGGVGVVRVWSRRVDGCDVIDVLVQLDVEVDGRIVYW